MCAVFYPLLVHIRIFLRIWRRPCAEAKGGGDRLVGGSRVGRLRRRHRRIEHEPREFSFGESGHREAGAVDGGRVKTTLTEAGRGNCARMYEKPEQQR